MLIVWYWLEEKVYRNAWVIWQNLFDQYFSRDLNVPIFSHA